MNFANLDINGLIALGVGILGVINTILQIKLNAKATTTEAKVEKIEQAIASPEAKEERDKMKELLDDVLNGKRK